METRQEVPTLIKLRTVLYPKNGRNTNYDNWQPPHNNSGSDTQK